ncbi:type IV conjugative transfer system coupling protein TraD [Francisellaceae bacterium]|nr:type IV conjugative transfer system coupling protein TraD [Francisellaceae bacterium]
MLNNITRGGQIFRSTLRMFLQVNKWVLSYYILFVLPSWLFLTCFLTSKVESSGWWTYTKAAFWNNIGKPERMIDITTQYGTSTASIPDIMNSQYYVYYHQAFNNSLFWGAIGSVALWSVLFFGIFSILGRKGKNIQSEEVLRGSTLDTYKNVNKLLISESRASRLKIGNLHLVLGKETHHIGFHGTTGTGKSTAYIQLMKQIRNRDQRMIIFDDGGDFASKFYDPDRGDIILNPFDSRCANWHMWSECGSDADYDNLAAAFIPEESDKDQFWMRSTRTLVADIARKYGDQDNPTYKNFLYSCLNMSLERLQESLKNTPAEQLVDKSIAKTAMTIRAVITNHVKSLRYLPDYQDQPRFSIRDWVLNEEKNKGACIFITCKDKDLESTRSLISLWIGLVSTHIKSLPKSKTRRIWVMLDEITKLYKLSSLPDTLATGRNYGLCCVIGFQNKAQMRMIYGRDTADAIIDLLSTQIFYRSTTSTIAEEVSKELGEAEVIEKLTNFSYGAETVRDGQTLNSSKNNNRRIVTPTQIQNLDDLEAYVKLPAKVPRAQIKLKFQKKSIISESFIERDLSLDSELENKLKLTEQEHSAAPVSSIVTDILLNAAKKPATQNEISASSSVQSNGNNSSPKPQSNNNNNSSCEIEKELPPVNQVAKAPDKSKVSYEEKQKDKKKKEHERNVAQHQREDMTASNKDEDQEIDF